MLQSFTRDYEDHSTEEGFQFTFCCDLCEEEYKSSFIEFKTQKKGRGLRGLAQGAGVLGSLLGSRRSGSGYSMKRGGGVLSDRFESMSPEWKKEHEKAFERAKDEVRQHFNRCHGCQKWICDSCYNEDEGLCTDCFPRQEITAVKMHADTTRRNIKEIIENAVVWKDKLEGKTTICPVCGKAAGTGKFCNNCGTALDSVVCPKCKMENAQGVHFCSHCGASITVPAASRCQGCGEENPPGMKFCGGCGRKL